MRFCMLSKVSLIDRYTRFINIEKKKHVGCKKITCNHKPDEIRAQAS